VARPRGPEVISPRALCGLLAVLSSCTERASPSAEGTTYTLYRTSSDKPARIHVASFDAAEDEAYNRENCDVARALFAAQPGIKTRFFCEKGRFRK
jgi:hypothetical protein